MKHNADLVNEIEKIVPLRKVKNVTLQICNFNQLKYSKS